MPVQFLPASAARRTLCEYQVAPHRRDNLATSADLLASRLRAPREDRRASKSPADSKSSVCRRSVEAVCRRFLSADKDAFPRHLRGEWPSSFSIFDPFDSLHSLRTTFRFSTGAAPTQK